MKALIIPSQFTTNIHKRDLYKFKNILKSILKLNLKNIKNIFKDHLLNTESYFYSHFPNILGKDNVYVVGKFYNEYTRKYIDQYSRYPSLNKNNISNEISFNFAKNNLNLFSFVMVGIRSGKIGKEIIKLSKKKNIPVVVLDYFDDKDVYMNHSLIHRGLKYKYDFDFFFKHDIPLDYIDEYTFPLAPMPIDPSSYPSFNHINESKKYEIFYRGRSGHGPRDDRLFLSKILKQKFDRSKIEEINSYEKISIEDYCLNFFNSKFAFSPSGKVWDSTRHTETAVYNNIPIIPIPDCKLSGSKNINSNNSIAYDPKLIIENDNYLQDIIDRIKNLLSNEREFSEVSKNWKSFVYENHTLVKKSQFIIETIRSKI